MGNDGTTRDLVLGKLETRVMEILWAQGASSVHDVVESLNRDLAYTTVMTTLSRLFTKGLLDRQKSDRAFVYSPRISREDWGRKRVGQLVAGFLGGPDPSRELLVSCLLDAVSEQDVQLLDELEKKIRAKRRDLARRSA